MNQSVLPHRGEHLCQRLWSGITQTVLKEDVDRLTEADAFVAIVVNAMRKDGLIH